MEQWQLLVVGMTTMFMLFGIAAFGVFKAMRKYGHSNSLDPKFLCTYCNRYYNNISEHLALHSKVV